MLNPTIAKREVTMHILKTFGIHMSKKLGQNFLVDERTVANIVTAAEVTDTDTILEIGPGIGTLTQGLAETGAQVVAVELDSQLLHVLEKTLSGYDNVRVIHGDILKIDISREITATSFKVVANLPYYITTPIIMNLLENRLPAEMIVAMVQKEVAERMVAAPGSKDYGALSVAVQYYTEPEIQFIVSPQSFMPPPKVESAVIRCRIRKTPPVSVINEKRFFQVVRAAFGQRRKTLSNALKGAGLTADAVAAALAAAGIDGIRRGETLSLAEFAAIADALEEAAIMP